VRLPLDNVDLWLKRGDTWRGVYAHCSSHADEVEKQIKDRITFRAFEKFRPPCFEPSKPILVKAKESRDVIGAGVEDRVEERSVPFSKSRPSECGEFGCSGQRFSVKAPIKDRDDTLPPARRLLRLCVAPTAQPVPASQSMSRRRGQRVPKEQAKNAVVRVSSAFVGDFPLDEIRWSGH
jgi:hypothetical protein